jgi:hypothetical protein
MDAPQADLLPVLQAVSLELTALGHMGTALQSVLSAPLPRSEDVQALDVFTQRLFVLADFLSALAATVPPGSRCDLGRALAGVNLADVAGRLRADTERPAAAAGELELFGDTA